MTAPFVLLAILTLVGAVAAMSLRNLVHCALALTAAFAGLAALYLQLDAQFVGFAQILVYVGAVGILVVFAILLTRGGGAETQSALSRSWMAGIVIAVVVFGVLTGAVLSSRGLDDTARSVPDVTVRALGDQLMSKYILPVEVIGLLLTAAMLGAVILAMHERGKE